MLEPRIARAGAWLHLHERFAALVFLAFVAWMALFRWFLQLGLYEDDHLFIARAMGVDVGYLVDRLPVFTDWPQGRPLGFFLPDLFTFIGDKLGGLPAIYLVGFAIVVLNSWLCYLLLRHRAPPSVALVAGATFLLFPPDTTKILLTHDFQLQPGLTFMLLASLAYARGQPLLAYPLSLGALLCYESAFLPFIGVPLLLLPWDRRLLRTMAWHLGAVVVILALVFAARLLMGEERAAGEGWSIIAHPLGAFRTMLQASATDLVLLFEGPLKAVSTWDLAMVIAIVLVGVATALVLKTLAAGNDKAAWWQIAQLALAGAILLSLGYGLAYVRPILATGRGTSVHLGATLGASVLVASAYWGLSRLASRPRLQVLAPVAIAAFVALGSGYGMTIARDFANVWQGQRAFWHDVAACCSDLQDGTVIIYEWQGEGSGDFIQGHSWTDPLVLERTYSFPAEWSNPPRLYSLFTWKERVAIDPASNGLRWLVPAGALNEHWEPLPQGNVIVLRYVNGHMVRLTQPIAFRFGRLNLKPVGPPTTDQFARGPLWPYLAAPP